MTKLLFGNSDWLLVCSAAVAVIGVALVFALLHARRRSQRLLGPGSAVGHVRGGSDAVLFAGLLLLALALLGPRIAHRTVLVSTAGVDAVVLFDVSASMRARDIPPSRLHRARRLAEGLLARLEPGDRVALAAYSGRGVVLTPLSPDTAALTELLPAIDTDLIRPGGSDLQDGVERALEAFDPASERSRVLVILSDGEARGRSGDVGAASAMRANTRIVGVALGSELGSTIPDGGAPLLDSLRRVVVSRRRRAPLQKLADATDGRLFVADEWGVVDLDILTREVRRTSTLATPASPANVANAGSDATEWVEERRTVPLVLPFAALAFALLWLEWARPVRLPRRLWLRTPAVGTAAPGEPWWRTLQLRKAAVAVCSLLPLLLTGAANETEREAESEALAWETLARTRPLYDSELLRLGVARATARHSEEASHAFRAVALGASDLGLAAIAYHDLGVLAVERGDFSAARDAFLDALALLPNDREIRFNLEWTLRALAAQPPPQASEVPPRRKNGRDRDESGATASGKPPPRPDRTGQPDSPEPDAEARAKAELNADSVPGREPQSGSESPAKPVAGTSSGDEGQPADAASGSPGEGAGGEKARGRAIANAPPLDRQQRAMWLERVPDDPSRALRSAASGGQARRRSREVTW